MSKYSQLTINMESGKEHQTMISLPSYEMYQAELLDRMLLSIQHTEEAFIDVNNRVITSVNARKDRLNLINARIQNISAKILSLYNQKRLMRITSPATLPKISTSDVPSNHPHQTVFYDREEIIDLAEEIESGAQPTPVVSNMPELSSMTLQNKLYNTRMQNDPKDLQSKISGATKHIHDITKLLLSLSKYRAETMGAVNSVMREYTSDSRATQNGGAPQPSDASQEGVLGQRPAQITSVAELMLFDTNTNVYEDNKVNYIQESGAVFNIRGRQTKVLSKKEKQRIEQEKQLRIQRRAIQKKEERNKKQLSDAPISFVQNLINKPKYLDNEFQYVGAAADKDLDINLKDDLFGGSDSDSGQEGFDDFSKRNKEIASKKQMEMTRALANAQEDHEMTYMNPNQSRMDRSQALLETGEPVEADQDAGEGADGEQLIESENGEGENEEDEDAEGRKTQEPLPEVPDYDPNSLEDLAPAERLRINQAISRRELEERQRLIEQMIAEEKERDPDALDEDIRTKVNKKISTRKGLGVNESTMITTANRKNKAPAIALGTVMAANAQQEISTGNDWQKQVFVSKQKTMRVGAPPRGPPPTGGRPGAPPKGPPPSSGRKSTKPTPAAKGASGGGAKAAPANSNIPKAPPIGHFMAYLNGNYDPANPPSDSGSQTAIPPVDDLNFNPAEQISGGTLNQADHDDLGGLLDAMDGDFDPAAVERSSMAITLDEDPDPNKPPKPLEQMSLAEQLQWSATRLKKKSDPHAPKEEKPAESNDPDQPPKPLDQMSLAEQLQWSATRLKKKTDPKAPKEDTSVAAQDPDQPPKPLDQMSLAEQLQWSATRLKKKTDPKALKEDKAAADAPASDQPPKPLDQMSLAEQLQWSATRLKKKTDPKAPKEDKTADAPASDQPPKPLDQMTLAEQLAWQATRLKKKSVPAAPKEEAAPVEKKIEPEPPVEHLAVIDESHEQDSFMTDNSMLDYSKVEEKQYEEKESARMTVIMEADNEDRSTITASLHADVIPIVAPPIIKAPPVAAKPSIVMAKPVLRTAATIKSVGADRRVSNIDRLKVAMAVRQKTMAGKKHKRKGDSSDDNESSSSDSDSG